MLSVQSLTCRRGARIIFRDLSFALNPGSLLLVSGTNGSGKSTLLRVMAGLLPYTEGEVHWQGAPIEEDRASYQNNLHFLGHSDAVKAELTVAEMMDYWRCLSGAPSLVPADPYGLDRLKSKHIRILSAGQRRRLALSRLILRDAALWVLDEPTTALDQQGQAILMQMLIAHRAKGGIAVIASHHAFDLPGVQIFTMPEKKS